MAEPEPYKPSTRLWELCKSMTPERQAELLRVIEEYLSAETKPQPPPVGHVHSVEELLSHKGSCFIDWASTLDPITGCIGINGAQVYAYKVTGDPEIVSPDMVMAPMEVRRLSLDEAAFLTNLEPPVVM